MGANMELSACSLVCSLLLNQHVVHWVGNELSTIRKAVILK